MKEDYQKALKILTLFFLLNLFTFNDGLHDQVWWCNIKWLLVIPKITSANLYKTIYDIINYSTFICPFESGKRGKEGKKLQNIEYLENEKSFFDVIKNIFHSF